MLEARTDTFFHRNAQHADAIDWIIPRLENYGAEIFPHGLERESGEEMRAIRQQYDRTSLAIRFRPDLRCIFPGRMTLLAEVKSEKKGRRNFSVEVNSYIGAMIHRKAGLNVVCFYVDLSFDPPIAYGCWLDDSYRPRNIYITSRFNFEAEQRRLRNVCPYAFFYRADHNDGAGTSYFLVPKDGFRLIEFDEFMRDRLGGPILPLDV